MPKQLKILSGKCIGCKSCELACSLANEKEMNPNKSRITVLSFIEGKYPLSSNIPLTCKQCADAPCLPVCPVDAISRSKDKMKTVVIDGEQCIGCGKCVGACPFGAMLFDKQKKKAFKCELCKGEPACVSICPTEAILFIQQKPFYSKAPALEIEGFSILSQRNTGNLPQTKSWK
jgi:carbon-monoxide dehydrogenase iron sulfur subunit